MKNTLEWCTLESYSLTLQSASHTIQHLQTKYSAGFLLEKKKILYDNGIDQLRSQVCGGQSSQSTGRLEWIPLGSV